jgi:hypothetical protein
MAKAGVDLGTVVGARGVNLEGVIPDKVNWKAHNYTHLMEQPTLFYATVVILGVTGAGDGINLTLAWAYVGLRIGTASCRRCGTACRCGSRCSMCRRWRWCCSPSTRRARRSEP